MERKGYIVPGYGGYIPGDKWRYGSRSTSEPPPKWRNDAMFGGTTMQPENYQQQQQQQIAGAESNKRPATRRQQRFQSAKSGGRRQPLENYATRPMDSSTQFPVQTTEMASQADSGMIDGSGQVGGGIQFGQVQMQNENLIVDPNRRGRPPSRAGQRPQQQQQPVDGRIINHQRADVLFMPNDPFKGLSSTYDNNGKRGRYYDPRRQQQQPQREYYVQNGQVLLANGNAARMVNGQLMVTNDGIPTAGYSGHIPGLRAFVGKPYGDAMRSLRDGVGAGGQSLPTLQPVP